MRRPKQDLSVGPLHVRCMRRTLSRRRIVAASHHPPTTLMVPSPYSRTHGLSCVGRVTTDDDLTR